ncbi:MAG: N-acetyltransferase [Dehalococcoidia bacterium]
MSELIVDTDTELSELFFGGDRDRAVRKVKRLISMGRNSYGHENIHVASHDSQVLGVVVAYSHEDKANWSQLRAFLRVMNICDKMRFILLGIPLTEIIMPEDLKPGDIYISNVVVGREYRGRGIGSFLLEKLKEQASYAGFRRLWLYVSHDNEIAIKLYEKMGFRVCRKRKLWLPWLKIETYKMELVV